MLPTESLASFEGHLGIALSPGALRDTIFAKENLPRETYTKMIEFASQHGIPVPVTEQLMQRGQQRFNINCSICHGLTAAGNGVAKLYGLNTVATLQDERIRKMADGEIFNTITNGKNTMMSYGGNVPVADRWAIIAYLRALQRSQNAAAADVPPEELAKLEKAEAKPPETKPAPSPEAQKK